MHIAGFPPRPGGHGEQAYCVGQEGEEEGAKNPHHKRPTFVVRHYCLCSSLPDHALFTRYIWEDELVDYEEQAAKESLTATADPEKKKATEKESKKATEKESKKATERESKKNPTSTTRKPRLAVENFGEED